MRLQQRLEQANETIGRLNRALEDHVKDGEEKQVYQGRSVFVWIRVIPHYIALRALHHRRNEST